MLSQRGLARNWNFIVYPDSAPENWRDILDETRCEWLESPLHDQDVDPTGERKKPHYHVTLLYPSQKSYGQVKEFIDQLNSPIPIPCQSVKGSIRYMVHKDNPDKHQYEWNDIVCHGGADLTALCAPTHTERLNMLDEILGFIRDNHITEFSDLTDMAQDMGNRDWLNVILNHNTTAIKAIISSRRHKRYDV